LQPFAQTLQSTEMRCLMSLAFILSLADSILLNNVEHARLTGDSYQTLFNRTKDDCVCEMLKSNETLVAFNYVATNQTCQLFRSNQTAALIQLDIDSSLIFTNQSAIYATFSKFILKCQRNDQETVIYSVSIYGQAHRYICARTQLISQIILTFSSSTK
jgi:hypothetical protein